MESRPVVRRRLDGVVALVGLALFGLCALVGRGGVPASEREVFSWINGLPNGLTSSAHAVQFLGVLAVGPVVAVIAVAARRPRLAAAALIVTGLKLIAERVVWHVVARQRPGVTEQPGVVIRAGTPTTGLSFVSGHVLLVTGLAWCVTPYLRGAWRSIPWIVVAVVAFARIYLGAHNPLDVLGGFAMGLAIGGLTNLLVGVPGRPERRVVDA